MQVEQHPFVASATAGNYFVTPMMGDRLFIDRAAENFEMIGVVTIIGQHFCGGIAAGKHNREEQCRSAPLQDALISLPYPEAELLVAPALALPPVAFDFTKVKYN